MTPLGEAMLRAARLGLEQAERQGLVVAEGVEELELRVIPEPLNQSIRVLVSDSENGVDVSFSTEALEDMRPGWKPALTAADLERMTEALQKAYPAPTAAEFWERFPVTRDLFRRAFADPVRRTCPGCGGEHSLAEACAWVRR